MKTRKTILILKILSFIIFNLQCMDNNPVEPGAGLILPQMAFIDEDMTFTYRQISSRFQEYFIRIEQDTQCVMTLEPYYIGKYEVTNAEYNCFIQDGGNNNPVYWSSEGWESTGGDYPVNWTRGNAVSYANDPYSWKPNSPVIGVSYYEAEAYCNWLSKKTGNLYYLPSSAQWQRAAKGPDPGDIFAGDSVNYIPFFLTGVTGHQRICLPVNSIFSGMSPSGCFFMSGNAQEITTPIFSVGEFDKRESVQFFTAENRRKNTPSRSVLIYDIFNRTFKDIPSGFRVCRKYK